MIELPKSYRMNVLVLKIITLNSSYGLSKIFAKQSILPTLTTAASCMVIQLSGSLESWCRARAVERCTSREGEVR